jgi:uncharacterized protein (TIGR03437 family)
MHALKATQMAVRAFIVAFLLALLCGPLWPQESAAEELDAAASRLLVLSHHLRSQAESTDVAKVSTARPVGVYASSQRGALAAERLALMEKLARQRPGDVLRAVLPIDVRTAMEHDGMPVERVEETLAEVNVTVHDGFLESPTVYEVALSEGRGTAFAAADQAGGLACGDTARLQIVTAGSAKVLARVELLSASMEPACSPIGEQQIAVILMHRPGSRPASSAAYWQQRLFGTDTMSVADYFAASSYGKASVRGTVFGWYAADHNYACGDLDTVRHLALSAAGLDIDFSRYSRLILIYEAGATEGCGAGGYGTLGCQRLETKQGQKPISISWLFARDIANPLPISPPVQVAIHELGHNLGLHHARSLQFEGEVLAASAASGTRSEYGDAYSVMGGKGDLSARHKHLLGWLEPESDIQDVSSSGQYTISPLQSAGPLPRALRVRRGPESEEWLWLEARLLTPWEHSPGDTSFEPVVEGVFLRYENSSDPAGERYTDRLTTDSSQHDPRILRPKLKLGQPWRDPHGPLQLQVVSQTAELTAVRVEYVEPCASVAPPGNDVDGGGGTFTFSVLAAPSCSWNVASDAAFASYAGPGSATGPGTVTFTFSPNDSSLPRQASLTVGNQVFRITQGSMFAPPAVKAISLQSSQPGFGSPLAFQAILQDGRGVQNIHQVEMRIGTALGKPLCAVSIDMPAQQFSILGGDLRTPVHTSSLRAPVPGQSELCRFSVLGYRWDQYAQNLGELPITFQMTLQSPLPTAKTGALAFYARVTGLDGRSTDWTTVRRFSMGEECVVRTAGSNLVLDKSARSIAYRVTAPEGCLWSADPGETGLRFDTGWQIGTVLLPMVMHTPAADGAASNAGGEKPESATRFEAGTWPKRIVHVTGRLGAPVVPGADSIVHGATFSRPIASGSWFSIFGANLAAITRPWTREDFAESYLPLGLDGVEVLVNGLPVPLSFVSAGQLNALLPELQGNHPVRVQVRTPFGASQEIELLPPAAMPGIFVYRAGGVAFAAARHADFVAVGPLAASADAVIQRPASPGDTIAIYGTGFGATAPAVDEHRRWESAARLMNAAMARVTIGGVLCDLEFIGKSGNGLYQVNVRVPALPEGNHRVVLRIGDAESQPDVWLRVEP